jgi:hypothetical protein
MQDKKAESHVDNISWLSWLCQGDRFPQQEINYGEMGSNLGKDAVLLRFSIGRVSSGRVCTAGLTTTTNEDGSWAV